MGPGSYVTSTASYYNTPKRGLSKRLIILVLGVLILVVGVIILFNVLGNRNNIATQSQHLSARLTNLTALTTDARTNLSSDDLKKINAEVSILVAGMDSTLASTLPKKLDKSIVAQEADTTSTTALSSALLAGTYDATYKTVLNEKLESITALLTEMYGKTKSSTLRTNLSGDYTNYETLLTDLAKITV